MNENQIKGKLFALKMQREEADDRVSRAANVIFWVAGINFLFAIFSFLTAGGLIYLIASGIISGILAGLGFWSKKSPMVGLIISFIILGGLFALDIFSGAPIGLLGFAGRIAVLMILGFGIYNVVAAKKVIREYDELAASSGVEIDN